MFRWIIIFIVGYLIYRILKGFLSPRQLPKRKPPGEIQDEMVQDPICKVYLPKRQAQVLMGPNGQVHYFCSPQCREKFIKQAKRGSTA